MSSSDFDQRAEARVGTTLRGKYRIDSVLGIGGMAVVYAATHRNQKRFAVKMLHRELSLEADVCARFLREGYAANTVNHPGAVAVLDDDVAEDGAAFLVMELLEGESVDGLATRSGGRLPLRVSLGIAYQALDVLDAAHKSAIVHRDIKPGNLFLMRDGRVKVLDFGIARLRDAATGNLATRTGAMLGTPAFMAPEQALGEANDVGPQTDVWALGATLFTLISGELVHEGNNPSQLLVRSATVPARSLSVVAPEAPESVVRLVGRALAFDRAARWASAAAMRLAIDEAHRELFGEPPKLEPLAALFDRGAQAFSDPPPRAPSRPATMTAPDPGRPAIPSRPTPAPRVVTTTAKPVSAGDIRARSGQTPWGRVAAIGFVVAAAGTIAVRWGSAGTVGAPEASTEKPAPSVPIAPPHDEPTVASTTAPSALPSSSVERPADTSAPSSLVALPKLGSGRVHGSGSPPPATVVAPPASVSVTVDHNPLRMPLQ